MQAEKITKIHAISEIQVQSGTIQCIDKQSYQILAQGGTYSATRAFSCLVEPIPGDKVLFSIGAAQQCHILSIIERLDNTETSLSFPGEVTINARHGQLSLNAQQGLNISSKQKITLASEEYSLIAKKALFAIDSLTAVGSTVVAKIRNIQTIADTVETIADNMLQKLKNSFRLVDGVDQKKSRDVIHTVKNLYSMRSKQAAILAKKDIKIDAERIHMG